MKTLARRQDIMALYDEKKKAVGDNRKSHVRFPSNKNADFAIYQ